MSSISNTTNNPNITSAGPLPNDILLAFGGNPVLVSLVNTLPSIVSTNHLLVDFCGSYLDACNSLLDHLNCPSTLRNVSKGCPDGGMGSFKMGCMCGAVGEYFKSADIFMIF